MRIVNKHFYFMYYLLRKPVLDILRFVRTDYDIANRLASPKSWLWIVLFLVIFTYFLNWTHRYYMRIFLYFLLFAIIVWGEYKIGYWKHEWLQQFKEDTKNEVIDNEPKTET